MPGAKESAIRLSDLRGLVAKLRSQRRVLTGVALAALFAPSWLCASLIHHVYFDRTNLPDLGAFIRFEPPGIGEVKDAHGQVLIELAREYRRVVAHEDVPPIVRHALLSAEDRNFFSHRGVDYSSLPRVLGKAGYHSITAWWSQPSGSRVRLPQGGSTLTQQLVRGYFLQHLTRENDGTLLEKGLMTRLASFALGVRATNSHFLDLAGGELRSSAKRPGVNSRLMARRLLPQAPVVATPRSAS